MQINIVHWYLMVVLLSPDYTRNIYDIIYPHNNVYVSTFWAMGHWKSLSMLISVCQILDYLKEPLLPKITLVTSSIRLDND